MSVVPTPRDQEGVNEALRSPTSADRTDGMSAPDPAPKPTTKPTPPDSEPKEIEPKVQGESKLDRVSSFLMSVVIGAAMAVGWLAIIYVTQKAFAAKIPARLEIVEVYGGGGGSPDGTPGATEEVNVPGAEASPFASNNMEDASEFEEPAVEQTSSAMIDALAEPPPEMAQIDIAEALPNAGPVASGKRSSKIGTGGRAYGFGPGDGGVAREQRWVIVFNPGQTADEYARQLDYLGVELAVPSGAANLEYASNFSSATPTKRIGLAKADQRLYFLWQGAGRKSSDVSLLQKAGIQVGNKAIFQFYPKAVEDILAQLEVQYKGRQPAEIRNTRFSVVSNGNGYAFKVLSQEPL